MLTKTEEIYYAGALGFLGLGIGGIVFLFKGEFWASFTLIIVAVLLMLLKNLVVKDE